MGSLQGTKRPAGVRLRALLGQTSTGFLPPPATTGSTEEPAGAVPCRSAVATRVFQESY